MGRTTVDKGVSERLRKFIYEYYQNDYRVFARKIGHSPETVKGIIYECANPPLPLLKKILAIHEKFSLTWLLNGHGEMFIPDVSELEKTIESLKDSIQFRERNGF